MPLLNVKKISSPQLVWQNNCYFKPVTNLQEYDIQQPLPNHLVLVVDDEDDMNYLISSILKKLHIKILFAATISEGLKMITSFPTIDLVFLDNRLPDGLGSQYIREFKNNSNRYVVVMSAYDTTYDRRMAENNGADGFMGKPFTRDQMTNVVYKLLSAPAD